MGCNGGIGHGSSKETQLGPKKYQESRTGKKGTQLHVQTAALDEDATTVLQYQKKGFSTIQSTATQATVWI